MTTDAVPDDAVGEVAARLAGEGVIGGRHVVLHLSGLLDRRALAPLDASGAALGSMHPLQTVSDPLAAPGLFEGAWAGVEGDERAVAAAGELAGFLRMTPVPIPAGGKPLYHAGATVVANYAVALAALGESLARRAGVPEPEAARLYAPLLRGVAANLSRRPPAEALTGPIRRGDHRTVAAHLELLHGEERALYRALGRLTLELARAAGLDGERAAELERLLHEG